MTEERSRYLANISKEERLIRNRIDYHKSSLKMKKWLTKGNKDEDDVSLLKSEIAEIKVIIKFLKKQLPAPAKTEDASYDGIKITLKLCPICGKLISYFGTNYCFRCGKKLR